MKEQESLEQKLERFYTQVPPPPNGLAAGRERLLAQAARLSQATLAPTKPRRPRMRFALAYKLIAAVLSIIVITGALGGGIVYAAGDSLPGETLYPVKLTWEDVRLAWQVEPAARARLDISLAAERAREMQHLSEQDRAIPEAVSARMVQHVEQTMAHVAAARPDDVPALLEQVMAQTRAQEQVLEQVQSRTQIQDQTSVRQALASVKLAYETADAAGGDPGRYRIEYAHRYQDRQEPQGTATPQQNQHQEQNPAITPTVTPQGNQHREQNGTATPQATPQGNQNQHREQNGTATPQATPQGNQHREQNGTATPQATPQGNQNQNREQNSTATPQTTPQGNQNQNQEQNGTCTPAATPQNQGDGEPQDGGDGEQDGGNGSGGGH